MKRIILALMLLTTASILYAQKLPAIDFYRLNNDDNCVKADDIALDVADYILKVPAVKDDARRLSALSFIDKWMECTPTYTFVLDEDAMGYFDEDPDITGVYMAALTKYQLQHPDIKEDRQITLGALKLLLDYADDDNNLVLVRDGLGNLMKAYKKGELERKL